MMEPYFHAIADVIDGLVRGAEAHLSSFAGEESDFVRLNQNKVRQAGSVTSRAITTDLICRRRHAAGSVSLSGDLEVDRGRLAGLVARLREEHEHLPEAPLLCYATEPRSTAKRRENRLPDGA